MKEVHARGTDVSFVDSSLAVGQQRLWSGRLTDDDALTVLAHLNEGRFDRIEVLSPASRLARDSGLASVDLTTWDRRALEVCPQTPLRWVGPIDLPLADGRRSSELGQLLLERAASAGLKEVRLGDATNSVERARRAQAAAGEAGVRLIPEVAFTTSPEHDDEVFVELASQLAGLGSDRLCLTDPSGLLSPERVSELVPKLLDQTPGVTWEFLGHCNNWLGPLNALSAAEAGVPVIHTAIPPLSSAESAPSLDVLVDNLLARGRGIRVQPNALGRASALLRFLALRHGLPTPSPREYSYGRLQHHLAEPQIGRLRDQLQREGRADLFTSVLEEVQAVRADLGYPVMTPELSDLLVDQAVSNVTDESRYEVVVPGLGRFLADQPHDSISVTEPKLEQRLETDNGGSSPTAVQDVGLAEIRASHPGWPDARLLEQAVLGTSLMDDEREKRLQASVPSSSPVVRLVNALTSDVVTGSIQIEKPGFRLHVSKTSAPDDELDDTPQTPRPTAASSQA